MNLMDFLQERFSALREIGFLRELNDRIAPLKSRYQSMSKREQYLVKAGGIVVLIWVLYGMIYKPYIGFREGQLLEYQRLVEDYEWLESQQERLILLLGRRGVHRDAFNDMEGLIGKYIKDSSIDYRPDNVVAISWQGNSPPLFLQAVNNLVNQGANLRMLEFQRKDNSPQVSFSVQLKI